MSNTEKDTARAQAAAQYASIKEMVDALECDYAQLAVLRDCLKDARVVGWNTPGYLPDSEPFVVDTADDARTALIDEMSREVGRLSDCEEVDQSSVDALLSAIADLADSDCEAYGRTVAGVHYWFSASDVLADEDDEDERKKLGKAAGDCEDEDDARRRIEEDALSVDVRSDWESAGHALTPSEFRILLCTGGPAVQIRGELDDSREPCRAWLEYQDWGTPWTEYHGEEVEQEVLLTYARVFYFGE